ncbi:hypothetical protein BCE75_11449 [Isoptericola sp. CG 20/1183]|uniref:DUF2207 domain-containing protein n=1 Tax=Isoptericola halotolerans TaxID=300560 RepID=A0ABX5ECV8_9MICO|nr:MULTISPECIES: hypothetical protein [Isoptericola]PRZ03237.1 hypothetical protein BCE75_11449 [Isoptericola sp. CG 20/1183]PRZ03551.1 hypothetical protein BCL65_11352 [Isoptericola halotolerans]
MESVFVGPRPSFLTRVEPWLSSHVPDAPPQNVVLLDAGASGAVRDAVRERVLAAAASAARAQRLHAAAQLLMVLLMLLFAAVVSGFLPGADEHIPLVLLVLVPLFVVVVVTDLRRVRHIRWLLNVPAALAEESVAVRQIPLTGMGSPPGDVDVLGLIDIVRARPTHDQAHATALLWDYAAALEHEAATWLAPEASETALEAARATAERIEHQLAAYTTASDRHR